MSDITISMDKLTTFISLTDDLCAARGDLAAAQTRIARLEADLVAQHPVVEAAVAAVEAHYADARLRELALAVRQFCARRACAERRR